MVNRYKGSSTRVSPPPGPEKTGHVDVTSLLRSHWLEIVSFRRERDGLVSTRTRLSRSIPQDTIPQDTTKGAVSWHPLLLVPDRPRRAAPAKRREREPRRAAHSGRERAPRAAPAPSPLGAQPTAGRARAEARSARLAVSHRRPTRSARPPSAHRSAAPDPPQLTCGSRIQRPHTFFKSAATLCPSRPSHRDPCGSRIQALIWIRIQALIWIRESSDPIR